MSATTPAVADLSRRIGVPPPAVDQLLDALVADGWLRVEWAAEGPPGHRAAGRRRNSYELRLDHARAA